MKRERRDGEDRVAEPDGGLDEDRRHDVREDLGEHDVRRALAPEPRRLDVVELGLAEHRRPHGARDDRREDGPMTTITVHVERLPRAATTVTAMTMSGIASNGVDDAADRVVGDPRK